MYFERREGPGAVGQDSIEEEEKDKTSGDTEGRGRSKAYSFCCPLEIWKVHNLHSQGWEGGRAQLGRL